MHELTTSTIEEPSISLFGHLITAADLRFIATAFFVVVAVQLMLKILLSWGSASND